MSKLGDLLRQTRLEKGITFDTVTKNTRLSEDIVNQLEEGGFSDLPSYNHAKNFVKNYAELLGLDWNEIKPLLDEECGKAGFMREPTVVVELENLHQNEKKDIGFMIKYIVPAVIVIALIFAGVKLAASIKHDRDMKAAQEQVQPQQSDVADDNDTEFNTVDQKTVQDTINAVNSQEQSDQQTAAGTAQPGQTADQTAAAQTGTAQPGVEAGANPADKTQTTAAGDKAVADNSVKKAVLNFSDVCWVHAKSDTGEEIDFIADKKTHREISFKKYFILDVGNAAVATVSFNGRTSGGLGAYKVPAKNLRFEQDPAGELKYSVVKQ